MYLKIKHLTFWMGNEAGISMKNQVLSRLKAGILLKRKEVSTSATMTEAGSADRSSPVYSQPTKLHRAGGVDILVAAMDLKELNQRNNCDRSRPFGRSQDRVPKPNQALFT
jgi:hypothetical protein